MARQDALYILTANDLLEGDVVFWSGAGWARDHRAAQIARNADETTALDAIGAAEKAARRIIDPYRVEVTLGADGTPVPVRFRERLRTLGPTVRLDLGKQAALRANSLL
ncbi:MAG: DUF2849 domain-containing protein [Alphaproteobacteria bacterium]|nr:DUF2849 domain-containing protein [Alphaproteobacteria bacterium]